MDTMRSLSESQNQFLCCRNRKIYSKIQMKSQHNLTCQNSLEKEQSCRTHRSRLKMFKSERNPNNVLLAQRPLGQEVGLLASHRVSRPNPMLEHLDLSSNSPSSASFLVNEWQRLASANYLASFYFWDSDWMSLFCPLVTHWTLRLAPQFYDSKMIKLLFTSPGNLERTLKAFPIGGGRWW